MKKMKCFLLFALISCGLVWAGEQETLHQEHMEWEGVPMGHGMPMEGGPHKFLFIAAEEHGGEVIKGAPYSAQAITERTQTLADGNRIVHKSTAQVYRDSEGRTRREQQWDAIGGWQSSEEPKRTVFIQDPVAKVHYVLDPENQVARKIQLDRDSKVEGAIGPAEEDVVVFEKKISASEERHVEKRVIRHQFDEKDAKKESLGNQMIEGIPVEGTRTTVTIPAGEMGNEMPIQIVSERWYSPDLKINVQTRHSDPRFGETVYQLTQIQRGEQDRSLFEVPRDYKVESHPLKDKIIHRKHK